MDFKANVGSVQMQEMPRGIGFDMGKTQIRSIREFGKPNKEQRGWFLMLMGAFVNVAMRVIWSSCASTISMGEEIKKEKK